MDRKLKPCKGKGKFDWFDGCGQDRYIFAHGLCGSCYRTATGLQKLKDRQEKSPPKKRYWIRRKKKSSGFGPFFDRIFDRCRDEQGVPRSEISGKRLFERGHSLWHWQFSHILHAGSYGQFGMPERDDNVVICTVDEHKLYGEDIGLCQTLPMWKDVFKKKQELTIWYNVELKKKLYGKSG